MASPLIKRFGHWLGTWRGIYELDDGQSGVLEITLSPHFNGRMFEVAARMWHKDTGELRTLGTGFWSLNQSGRIENVMWAGNMGFCHLEETPDDPEVLAMEGSLAGNLTFSVSFRTEDDALLMSSGIGEGYAISSKPRTYSRMYRLGMAPPEVEHE